VERTLYHFPLDPASRQARLALAGTAAVALLALVETAAALMAPLRAPTEADWAAAAAAVREGWKPGDLIVAAPAWADPILRVHLGDLIPPEVAGRMDDERFARVWEVSQRGGRSAAGRGGPGAEVRVDRAFGRMRVRLIDRPAPVVTYDFVARWNEAQLARRGPDGTTLACPLAGGRMACPGPWPTVL